MTQTIKFTNNKRDPAHFLSTYYLCEIELDGLIWPSAEHYFNAAKFDDGEYCEIIRSAKTAFGSYHLAKFYAPTSSNRLYKYGGRPEGIEWITPETLLNDVVAKYVGIVTPDPKFKLRRDDVMRKVLRVKFEQHPDLAKKLIETGDAILLESTIRDSYWGGYSGRGKNMIGEMLMELRRELAAKIS